MNIGVEINLILSSSRTGVAEYTFELPSALFEIDKKNQYFLFSNFFRKNVHFIHTCVPNESFEEGYTQKHFILLKEKYNLPNKFKGSFGWLYSRRRKAIA